MTVNSILELIDFKEKEKNPSEETSGASVSLAAYSKYFRAGGGSVSLILLLLNCIMSGVLLSGSDYWFNIWTNAEKMRAGNISSSSGEDYVDTFTGISIYSILICAAFLSSIIFTFHLYTIGINASVNLHNRMLRAIIHAPLTFFNCNSVGNIITKIDIFKNNIK